MSELPSDFHPEDVEEMRNLYWEEIGKIVDTIEDKIKSGDLSDKSKAAKQLREAVSGSSWLHNNRLAIYVLLVSKQPGIGLSPVAGYMNRPRKDIVFPFPFIALAAKAMRADALAALRERSAFQAAYKK